MLNDVTKQPTKKWIKFNSVNGSNSGGCTTSGTDNCTWQIHTKCVTERIGTHAYDDTAPRGDGQYPRRQGLLQQQRDLGLRRCELLPTPRST